MRPKHELERGIICEKCLKHSYKGHYKRIKTETAKIESTTGEYYIIHRLNLCNKCFEEYTNLINEFLDSEK